MDFDQLFPNRFLKAGEFGGKDVTYKITGILTEELDGAKGKQVKGIVQMENCPKQWVLNKTNGLCLKQLFGRETSEWIGKRVTLFPAEVRDPSTDGTTLAIRVRGSPDMKEAVMEFTTRLGKGNKTFKLVKTGQMRAVPVAGQDAELAKWRLGLWSRAEAVGIDKNAFLPWAEKVLGAKKAWKTWTLAEVDAIGEALEAMESPAADEPPPDVALPTDAAQGEA